MTSIPATVLGHLALGQALLVVATVAMLLAHAVHAHRRARRDMEQLAVVHALLALGVGRRSAAAVRALPFRLQVRLLHDLAPTLTGAHRAQLTDLMTRVGVTERAERWCHGRRWWRRLHGLRLLTELRAGVTVAPALLDDPRPEVRTQAVEWVSENPDPVLIERLLGLLGDERSGGLIPVKDALLRIGKPCLDPLIRFLADRRGPALRDALEIAVVLADPRMLQPALTATTDEHPRIRALAATLAAALGGTDTVQRLIELLDDSEADVRAAAARGLARLQYWPGAARVAALLRDSAWSVRSEAALALRALGATGALLLNRALTDEDPFARDAARHVLDLPTGQAELAA